MKSTKNIYHIDIDDTKNWSIKLGDKELFFDPEYRPEFNAIQWGTVKRPAMAITKQPNMTQPVAEDTVYFHHHVYDNKITFEDECFRWAEHRNLFFIIRDDEIIMLNDYILVRPKEDSDEDMKTSTGIFTKSTKERTEQRGYVVKSPFDIIDEGQEIAFVDKSDYQITIKDEDYYIMELRDVIATIDNEVANPVGEWTLIEPLDEGDEYEENDAGVFVSTKKHSKKQHQGRIYKTHDVTLGIKDDDTVIYDRRAFYSIIVNNQKLYGVNTERDIFILL